MAWVEAVTCLAADQPVVVGARVVEARGVAEVVTAARAAEAAAAAGLGAHPEAVAVSGAGLPSWAVVW